SCHVHREALDDQVAGLGACSRRIKRWVFDEPDQLAGAAIRNGGGAEIHDRERRLVGNLVVHAPFDRGLPAGRLTSGRQIPTCLGQTLNSIANIIANVAPTWEAQFPRAKVRRPKLRERPPSWRDEFTTSSTFSIGRCPSPEGCRHPKDVVTRRMSLPERF